MKKLSCVLAVFLIFAFSVSGFAYDYGVYDEADLFSDIEEVSILEEAEEYAFEKDYSIAVVTTDFTSGLSSEEFADDYLDYLIDNEEWQENSLLFLIDIDNRYVWISTTGDCRLAYDDSEIDEIIDNGYDNLASGYYADCVISMIQRAGDIDTVVNGNEDFYIVDEDYFGDNFIQSDDGIYQIGDSGEWVVIGDDYNYDYDYDYKPSRHVRFDIADFLIYLVVGLAIGAIAAFVVKSRYKNMGKGDEFSAEDIVLNLTSSNDSIISRNVITTRIPRNNNHSRPGGSGGGSSVHRSGGGRSHGGGGRRF